MDKTEKLFGGFEGKINGAFKGISQGLGINLGGLTKVALIAAATTALISFGKQAIQVASDLREVQNVVDTTFGHMSNQVNEFASNSIKQFGLSELSAKKYSSTMGAMLKSSGLKGQTATNMSIELAKLSADMASFYNLQNDAAFEKIMSGMSGMTQPLKELGINMNIANLENYALSQGIRKSWQEMNQAEQTMLRYNYLLSVTGDAQGDFAKESHTWSNQIKILKEQWQEFMGLIGKALIEIFLPVVRVINKLLEGLIKVTKEIGKIYTLLTGKEIAVESNNNIADSALDAAEGENKIADGIGKAAKAAKKALAPFDELNIMQNNLSNGGGSGGIIGGLGSTGTSGLNTTLSTKQVDEGPDRSKWDAFFIWLGDKWNGLKQLFAVPIMVPAPVFADLKNPIYEPNWGLEYPKLEMPEFPTLKVPIFSPVWGLEYPSLSPLVIPPLVLNEFEKSLEGMKQSVSSAFEEISTVMKKATESQSLGLRNAYENREKNYDTHKENVGKISHATSEVLVRNLNEGLSKVGINTNSTIVTTQNNMQTWGKNIGAVAGGTAKALVENMNEGFKSTAANMGEFQKVQNSLAAQGGTGVVSSSYETAKAMRHNYLEAFKSTANSFMNLMKTLGEDVKSVFRGDASFGAYARVITAGAIGVGALALAAPAVIPYAGAALGGLATIPALAKGAVIPPNSEFLAVLGDQKSGTNIETPERLLRQIMREEMGGSSSNSGGDTTIIVKIGEDTITEKVVSNINRRSRISGKTIVEV